jgi:ssDNA-binding Zn-finger/Zn-ribbon topoisomerase 1
MAANLACPNCGERVLDMGKYTMGQDDARYERATCPQCRAELVRHPDLEDNTWKAHRPKPTADEELGGSG